MTEPHSVHDLHQRLEEVAVDPAPPPAARPPSRPGARGPRPAPERSLLQRGLTMVGPGKLSVLYLGALLVLAFGLWVPDTFFRVATLKSTLADFSIVGILALGLVVALVAGAYDLSVGWTLGLSAVTVSTLVRDQGVNPAIAVGIAVLIGVVIGVINGFLVAKVRINSFIATLGVSSVLSALVVLVSDNVQKFGLPTSFTALARPGPFGIGWPVYYLALLAVAVWFVLQHTPVGRYLYATGGNPDAARLAGVRTDRMVFGALVVSAVLASLAGVVLAAKINGSSPTIGPSYLLPAFAAAFLGSTQISPGRHNVWGTILAIVVLAFGTKGFDLGGVEFWVKDLFYGLALLFAVGLGQVQGRLAARRERRRQLTDYDRLSSASAAVPAS